MLKKLKIGIVGCGNISPIYVENIKAFEQIEVSACCDVDIKKAEQLASQFNITYKKNLKELLADPDISIVLNLTNPNAHSEISIESLKAGKNVYSEKPLAINTKEAKKIIQTAQDKNLLVGCAPDSFLATTFQKAKKIIKEDIIGKPIAVNAFMMGQPPETWHPNPAFLYQKGAGPMFDMGPYYLTVLIELLGPIKSVSSTAITPFTERTITSKLLYGQKIKVETPTYVLGILNFESGSIGTITTTYDVWACELPFIEIYGTKGTISLHNPNHYEGIIKIYLKATEKWDNIVIAPEITDKRGLGIADMATALIHGKEHQANTTKAYHVLSLLEAIVQGSKTTSVPDFN